jgi:hypothetical protein
MNQNERYGTEAFESARGVTSRLHAERMRRRVVCALPIAERTKWWSDEAVDVRVGVQGSRLPGSGWEGAWAPMLGAPSLHVFRLRAHSPD